MAAAVAWSLVAFALFFAQRLPNNPSVARLDILLASGPVLDAALLPHEPSGIRYLPQRMPVFAAAAVILIAAAAAGDLLVRRLGYDATSATLRVAIGTGFGLSIVSLTTMLLGVAGLLRTWSAWPLLVAAPLAWLWGWHRQRPNRVSAVRLDRESTEWPRWTPAVLLACLPFAAMMVLGAALPSIDFDVREYHLQGPKEWFLAGRVTRLDHNVYTSFPFLTEMPALLGMTLVDDWWTGALVGKVVLAAFGFLTAAAVFAVGREIAPAVGVIAAAAWLTSPWCHRVSTIAYAEGGLAYYVAATLAAVCLAWQSGTPRTWAVAGFLAGSGMACKYPGLVQTVLPAAIALGVWAWRRRLEPHAVRAAALFAGGVALAVGPWLLKNLLETGNPVYPLGYSVFGGTGLDDAWAARWRAAHSPPVGVLTDPLAVVPDLLRSFNDALTFNDWQTPLVLIGGPLGLLVAVRRRPRPLILAVAASVWLFGMWWALTHRIDRFWVPALPVWCVVAAAGLAWPRLLDGGPRRGWTIFAGGLLAVVTSYHLLFNLTPLIGLNSYLTDYAAVRKTAARSAAGIDLLNEVLAPSDRPLLVGEAQVFDAEFVPIYNTVFDESIFQRLTTGDASLPDGQQPTAPAAEVCERLRQSGVTHVFVNWSEVLRYREPGSYGYTDFVTPRRLRDLVTDGVLAEVLLPAERTDGDAERLAESTRAEIERWGPKLIDGRRWQRFALYRVVCGD